jgi:beta-barrel assembly-enhancing protease
MAAAPSNGRTPSTPPVESFTDFSANRLAESQNRPQIPQTKHENKQAKLELIQKWPEQLTAIRQSIADGSFKSRRWADVEDVGFRKIEDNQKDDIKLGQEAIRDLKQSGLMPKEVEGEVVVGYVRRLAQKIAANSDLQVPLQTTVLNSKEINAFALPGGFVFIERGILEAAEDESQLAGVIAHEISHAVAPPRSYVAVHPAARLEASQREVLIRGLRATVSASNGNGSNDHAERQ